MSVTASSAVGASANSGGLAVLEVEEDAVVQ
jgi:hypothetical protein